MSHELAFGLCMGGGGFAIFFGALALALWNNDDRTPAKWLGMFALAASIPLILGATATVTSRTTTGKVEHAPDLRCIAMERAPFAGEWKCTQTVRREP